MSFNSRRPLKFNPLPFPLSDHGILKLYKTCSIISINSNWPLRSTHPPHPPLKGHGKCKSNETCKCHIHFHFEINIVKKLSKIILSVKRVGESVKQGCGESLQQEGCGESVKKGFKSYRVWLILHNFFHIFLTAWGWAPSLPLTAAGRLKVW